LPLCSGQDETAVFRSGVTSVRIDVQALQDNELITDLTAQDFVVFDQDAQQKITYFGRDSEPLSLLLLFDVSGSMSKYIEQVATVARQSLRYLRSKDRVGIMAFARKQNVTLDLTGDLDTVAQKIRETAQDETLGSATLINDALLAAARHMENATAEEGRRAVLILTDNLGLNFQSPDQPVIDALNRANTVLNAIVVGRGSRPGPPRDGGYRNPDFTPPDVFSISEVTGGEAVRADKAGQAFSRMIERIRTRYSLHFNKPEAAQGLRQVRVELTPAAKLRYPRSVIRARQSYFASR